MVDTSNHDGLANRLAAIREQRGDTGEVSEVGEVVAELMTTMEGDLSADPVGLHEEIKNLADYIARARAEIAAIQTRDISDHHIPSATDELDAVVQATEEATGAILDAAEELEALGESLGAVHAEKITEVTTKIFEASNFQDITGQRITKVVATLRYIEDRITSLGAALGGGSEDGDSEPRSRALEAPAAEASLINGPQMPGAGNNQDEIDRLFDSLE
jgi:chemotaxis protein CheZ